LVSASSFLISTLTQFFAPAEQRSPLVVERRHLPSANSLYDHDDGFGGRDLWEPLLAIADTLTVQLGGGLNLGREMVGAVMLAGILLLLLKTDENSPTPIKKLPCFARPT